MYVREYSSLCGSLTAICFLYDSNMSPDMIFDGISTFEGEQILVIWN